MVTQWGMSDAIGPLEYEEKQGEGFLGYTQTQRASMSNETAQLIDSEIKRLVEGGLTRAREVIKEHLEQLHAIAGALLDYETITGEEIKRIVAGEDIDRPDEGAKTPAVAKAGTSIPKTRRPSGPFGTPSPLGA